MNTVTASPLHQDEVPHDELRRQRYHRLLGDLLVDGGFVEPQEIDFALRIQAHEGGRLGDILVRSGRVDATTLRAILKLQALLDRAQASDSTLGVWLNGGTNLSGALHAGCHIRLGELLVAEGEISAAQLERAIAKQQSGDQPLGELLIEAGWLNAEKLRFYLRLQKHLAAAAATAMLLFGQQAAFAAQPAEHTEAGHPQVLASATAPAANPVKLRLASQESNFEQNLMAHSSLHRRQALKEKKKAHKLRLAKLRAERKARAERQKLLASGVPDNVGLHKAVMHHANQFSIPADLIYAIIQTESSFNPNARSPANAYGLMQVVPETAGLEVHRLRDDCTGRPTARQLLDPKTNLYFGTAYLRILLDHYFKNVPNLEVRTGLAIAAYNMGPSRLVTLIKRKGAPGSITALRNLLRSHAPQETRDYFEKVTTRRARYLVFTESTPPLQPA